MKSQTIQIVIIDDHQLVIDGLQLLIEKTEGVETTASFTNGLEAIKYIETHEVDVILLDIEMPIINGIEVCKKIKTINPDQKIIALTMLIQPSIIDAMMNAGVNGFLIKNTSAQELIFAIKEVCDGRNYFSQEVKDTMASGLTIKGTKKQIPKLSRREKEITQLILDSFSTKEIASKLFISPGTVETHRKNILNKLGVKNTAGLVKLVIEEKLI